MFSSSRADGSAARSLENENSPPHLVELDAEHPGFRDPSYRARRDAIARLALAHAPGSPPPRVSYSPGEHALWAQLRHALDPLHERRACRAVRDAQTALHLPEDRIPQLSELNARLALRTGFRLEPVAGLVSADAFLRRLGDGVFLSTQYVRHMSRPDYTPEPDVVHELVGHAATLAHPTFAALNRALGRAAVRGKDRAALRRIERLYWYTLEYGLVIEEGELKVLGAGLLSSIGELGEFEQHAQLRPFVVDDVAETPYDPSCFQKTLFVAESFDSLRSDLLSALDA